ncbi:MAG: S9 family peptidase [Bryobacterales bacterium]|nr:S9 family peptidase [Bryobacterales bacterium]MBV9397544.1 S9 family peptidase [Bryobacterales bacterium]
MPVRLIYLSLFAVLIQIACSHTPKPPETRHDDVSDVLHGVKVDDHYRWLEDQNSPETRKWIDAQNAYTHSILDKWSGREAVSKRFTELRRVETIEAPVERGGRLFFRKRQPEQEQSVIYMSPVGSDAEGEVLVDPNPMSADHSTNAAIADVSKDGKILAYMLRLGGKDESEIHLMDVNARRELPDRLPAAVYFEVDFLPDGSGFYYATMINEGPDAGPRLRFHKLGTDVASDTDVFGKGYSKEDIVVGAPSEDGRHLVVQAMHGSSADKVEIWTQDLMKNGPIEQITKGIDARFFAFPGGNQLFLQTNWNAPHGRVLAMDFANPGREHWREVVPETEVPIDNIALAGGKLLVSYINNASSVVKVFQADGKPAGELKFPALGAVSSIQSRWENRNAFIGYSSFVIPYTVYRWESATGNQFEWARQKVPVDSSRFAVEQVWFPSKDGTKIPMFLVHKKGAKPENVPALLTGYGGFVISLTPDFSPDAIVWAEHGGVYAQVNLRGGGEFGEAWHRAGMLDKKQNVFDDFIAASEWLIANKYTDPSKLAILGGSNGGLLVGAALTQRPDLYRAVVCWHPLLDMLRYDQFMEAQFWVSEYGSAKDAEQFKWLNAYSPYQHVKSGVKYPAVLFMTGDGDTRVAPLHARKMAALLQANTASDRPILLRYELTAGHSGGRSVTQGISDATDMFSFLFEQLGVTG